jgi:hypothetical protein
MTQSFYLIGRLPGLNELLEANRYRGRAANRTRRRWNGYAQIKKQHGDTIYWQLLKGAIQPMRQVHIDFVWVEPDRRRDPDNVTAGGRKIILDALVKAGVLVDDSSVYVKGWTDTFEQNKREPGVRVVLNDLSDISDLNST